MAGEALLNSDGSRALTSDGSAAVTNATDECDECCGPMDCYRFTPCCGGSSVTIDNDPEATGDIEDWIGEVVEWEGRCGTIGRATCPMYPEEPTYVDPDDDFIETAGGCEDEDCECCCAVDCPTQGIKCCFSSDAMLLMSWTFDEPPTQNAICAADRVFDPLLSGSAEIPLHLRHLGDCSQWYKVAAYDCWDILVRFQCDRWEVNFLAPAANCPDISAAVQASDIELLGDCCGGSGSVSGGTWTGGGCGGDVTGTMTIEIVENFCCKDDEDDCVQSDEDTGSACDENGENICDDAP